MESKELAIRLARALDAKKAVNVHILAVEDLTTVTEYFVIATGMSTTHVGALADEAEFQLDREGVKVLDNVSFSARSGEILGIAGIAGSGQRELLEAIAGLQHIDSGEITYISRKTGESVNLRDKTPLQIRDLGVRLSFVPEDRLGMGLVGSMNMTDNVMLRSYQKGKSEFLDRKTPGKLAARIKNQLEVVTPSISAPVAQMSGGNVQRCW